MATTTDTPTHLLTPQRVDQLVREHYDPPAYLAYPAELIDDHEACLAELDVLADASRGLAAAGLTLLDTPDAPEMRAHAARVEDLDSRTRALEDEITRVLSNRRDQLEQLYRALPHVAAERQPGQTSYLGRQQWLLHVHQAVAEVPRRDKRTSILAVAEVLAEHTRTSGVCLAGVVEMQTSAGIPHSTWTRAYNWLVQHGLAVTLHSARALTMLERALAIGTETHAHVRRWRAVIQLHHVAAKVCRPTKWVPPTRRVVKSLNPLHSVTPTGHRPVDGASRPMAAPSSRPATKKKMRRSRKFDPLSRVLLQRLQQHSAAFRGVRACSVLPHLLKLAHADAEPAAILTAIADLHLRSGLRPGAASLDPTRRAVWALSRLDVDDVVIASSKQNPPSRLTDDNWITT